MNPQIEAVYIALAFSPAYREAVIEHFGRMCREVEFDAVAVTGVSGLLFGPSLAHAFAKKLVVVRKVGDGSHSGMPIEGWDNVRRIVFVDDFIHFGNTAKRCHDQLTMYRSGREWAGMFLWASSDDYHHAKRYVPWVTGKPVYQVQGTLRSYLTGDVRDITPTIFLP